MPITQERFKYFFDKLSIQKLLVEKKLELLLSDPDKIIVMLEMEEESVRLKNEILDRLDEMSITKENLEVDLLERLILDPDDDE